MNTWVTNIFLRDTIMLPRMHQISNIFAPSAPTMRGLHVLLNYPYTNIKKMVCPKSVWMLHCSWTDWESILWGESKKEGDRLKRGIDTLSKLWVLILWKIYSFFYNGNLVRKQCFYIWGSFRCLMKSLLIKTFFSKQMGCFTNLLQLTCFCSCKYEIYVYIL